VLEPNNRAQRYRFRAEELRTVADDWMDDDAMITLERLAMQYEQMADDIERLLNADGSETNERLGAR